jgi:hypothetical protein
MRSANRWKKYYEPMYYVRVEKEMPGYYNIYLRRKKQDKIRGGRGL